MLEKNINIFYLFFKFYFCGFILFFIVIQKSQALTLEQADLCMDRDFVHNVEKKEGRTILHELSCKKYILDGDQIHISDFKSLHTVMVVRNLAKDAHKNLIVHWMFDGRGTSGDRNLKHTYYSPSFSSSVVDHSSKILEAEAMYKESKFGWIFAIVEVLFSESNNFRTHASKNFDPYVHVGVWELRVLERKSSENSDVQYKILSKTSFTVLKR